MPPGSPVDWIALRLLPGLGPISVQRILERFPDPAEIAYRLPPRAFLGLTGIDESSLAGIAAARKTLRKQAEREWRRCEKFGVRVLPCVDPDYPAALGPLPDRPVVLYLRGRLPHDVTRVAVVGSRNPTAYGRRVAAGLAAGLAARGVEVVSGGARGVDTHAHRGALEEGGRTVAVVGAGILHPYPVENEELFEEIAESGAVLSEFGPDEPPLSHNFPRRNRVISGLSAAVVVVEAARRSGALITASHALDQGREVLAVPGPVSSPRSEGANRLLQQGAKLVQNVDDILEEMPPIYRSAVSPSAAAPSSAEPAAGAEMTPDEALVLGMLDEVEPVHLDDLAEKTPFGVGRLQAALFGLVIRGAVEQSPGRYYLSRPRRDP